MAKHPIWIIMVACILLGAPAFAQSIPLVTLPPSACTGADDTAAISSAISMATSINGTVALPATATGCKVSSGFTITTPIAFVGFGPGAKIVGTLGSTTDLFLISPPSGSSFYYGYRIDNLVIAITGGKNAIEINTATCFCYIGNSSFSHIDTTGSPSLSGASIRVTGQASPYHGIFSSSFTDNILISDSTGPAGAAYSFSAFGDSNRVVGGATLGIGYSLYMDQVPGAGNFTLSGSPMLTACGGIFIPEATAPILRDFQMETVPYPGGSCTSTTGAVIQLGDIGKTVSAGVIGPGQIQVPAGTGYSYGMIVANSDSTSINGMRISNSVAGGSAGIWITTTSTNTHFGPSMLVSGWGSKYLDAGVGTTHPTLAPGAP